MSKTERELLIALFDFVSESVCRQANTVERMMLSEAYRDTGEKYEPLLRARGLSPSQISFLDFNERVGRDVHGEG